MGSGLLFCLSRPEALRAEAQMLHALADFIDPSDEDCPHCGQSLADGAVHPLPTAFVLAQGPQHQGFQAAGLLKHGHQLDVPPRV